MTAYEHNLLMMARRLVCTVYADTQDEDLENILEPIMDALAEVTERGYQ